MSKGTEKGQGEGSNTLNVPSVQSDRHGIILGICKVDRVVFNISLDDYPHLATSLEKLRRKQLVTILQAKIDAAARAGWLVIPFDASDLNDVSDDLDIGGGNARR